MLDDVRRRIADACERSGRDPTEVRLVAVTKGHGAQQVRREIIDRGHRILGENRVQEWLEKADALPGGVEWHLIGSLQRNKIKYLDRVHLIHSLDSERLADALEAYGERSGQLFRTLLQVNVAGEASKRGVAPAEVDALLEHVTSLPHVNALGLMTMAPYATDAEASRPVFRTLRRLGASLGLEAFSMGMSGDFEVAVEEGATLVRVGTALFPSAHGTAGT